MVAKLDGTLKMEGFEERFEKLYKKNRKINILTSALKVDTSNEDKLKNP